MRRSLFRINCEIFDDPCLDPNPCLNGGTCTTTGDTTYTCICADGFEGSNYEETDVECENSTECNDNNFCNGTETCVNGNCITSAPPNCSGTTPVAMKPPTNANVLVTVVMMVPFVTAPKPVTTAPVQPERRQTVLAQRPLATKAPTDVNAIAPAVTMVPFVTAPKPVTTAFVDLVSLLTALAPHLIATTRPTGVSVTATHNVTMARSVMVKRHAIMAFVRLAAPPTVPETHPCNESLDRCECSNASHCDDSIACTTDQCIGGNCFNADNCVDPDVCNANTGITVNALKTVTNAPKRLRRQTVLEVAALTHRPPPMIAA